LPLFQADENGSSSSVEEILPNNAEGNRLLLLHNLNIQYRYPTTFLLLYNGWGLLAKFGSDLLQFWNYILSSALNRGGSSQ